MKLETIVAFVCGIAIGILVGGVWLMMQLMEMTGFDDPDRFMQRLETIGAGRE